MRETNSEEEWRPIPGFGSQYEASGLGRIRSVDRWITKRHKTAGVVKVFLSGRVLRPHPGRTSLYLAVGLSLNGKATHMMVHRLVAMAFLGDRSGEGLIVCHSDGDMYNNTPSNLRWDTYSENIRDQVRHGTHPRKNKTHCPWGHEMIPENQIPSIAHRKCLACKRARAHFDNQGRRVPSVPRDEFQSKSDEYFEKIVAGAA